jgi:signal transduction histidine kinase/CheY-like chemotaxis protein
MALVEGPTHIFRDVNDEFCRLVRRDRDALLGCPFSTVVSQHDEEQASIALLDRIYRTGAPGTLVNEPQSRSAGDEGAYWSYAAWAAPAEAGPRKQHPTGIVVQVTDTTEDHTFREMAASMNQELIITSVRLSEQAETMADAEIAKDQFLAMLGHEIRNPLSAISNAAALLEMRTTDQEKVQQPVGIIIRQVRHTARLVEDLMDVARITHGKMELRKERMDLCAAARRAAELAQPLMTAGGCEFSVSTPTQPIWLDGDGARLEQILGNLLDNAAKYTQRTGRVMLALKREGDHAVVEVRDTGIGIAPEMLPRIFDVFVQEDRSLSRSKGGLGIGLALVKRLAELHGGSVGVESGGLGLGSVFTVRLPAARDGGAASETAVGKPAATVPSLNVLLVDDNVLAALPLADILELWGHKVRIAHDGPSALIATREDTPDVVLLDLGLPGMDGYQVAQAMRAMPGTERVRIIALTGYGSESDRSLTREAGFTEHLVKPVDVLLLQGVLAATVR